jgi:hypothetical protein
MRSGLRNTGHDGKSLAELNDNYNIKNARKFLNPVTSISAGHSIHRMFKYSKGYVIMGNFTQINGQNRAGIAFLNHDLSLSTFNPVTSMNASSSIMWFQELANGDFYLSGNFLILNGVNRRFVARFNAAGTLQASPNPTTTTSDYVPSSGGIWNFLEQNGGQLFGFGNFTRFANVSITRGYYHVMTTAAAPVSELTTGFSAQPVISKMSNGKLLFRANGTAAPISFQGTATNGLMILNSNYKTVDTSFVVGTGFTSDTASTIVAQPFNNNHIFTGTDTPTGKFNGVSNGSSAGHYAIFDEFGSLVNMPNKGTGFNGTFSGAMSFYYDKRNGLYHIQQNNLRTYNGSANCRTFAINESGGHETAFWGIGENNMTGQGVFWNETVSFLHGGSPLYLKGTSYSKPMVVFDTQTGDFIA